MQSRSALCVLLKIPSHGFHISTISTGYCSYKYQKRIVWGPFLRESKTYFRYTSLVTISCVHFSIHLGSESLVSVQLNYSQRFRRFQDFPSMDKQILGQAACSRSFPFSRWSWIFSTCTSRERRERRACCDTQIMRRVMI